MKRIIKLNESDIFRIVQKIIQEQEYDHESSSYLEIDNDIEKLYEICSKKNGLSQEEKNILIGIDEIVHLSDYPGHGWSSSIDEKELISYIKEIKNSNSYMKINKALVCLVNDDYNQYSKLNKSNLNWNNNTDAIKEILKYTLSGLSGLTDKVYRDEINSHFKKIGVKVDISLF